MTRENRQKNIELEVAEAEDRLAFATLVLNSGGAKIAATLAYYGAFHYARALLLMEGLESRTHSGLGHLINLHFVRTGRLSPEMGRALSDLYRERERSEYDAASVVTQEMATEAVELARAFARAARALLLEAGFRSGK